MKLFKKVIALMVVAVLSMTVLAGCGKQKAIDNSEIVMTVGDKKVELGMANFVVRYQQPYYEQQFDMYTSAGMLMEWDSLAEEGVTYEEFLKKAVVETLQTLYIVDAHAADYNVTITEAEQAKIDEAAAAFKAANSKEAYEQVSGKYASEYFRLITISEKMHDAVKDSHTPEIKEGEANQKIMYYVEYATTSTDASTGATSELSDEEVKKLKQDAQTLLDGAKANGNLEAYAKEKGVTAKKAPFSASNEELEKKLVESADKLELNGFTEVIEGETAIYVAQVTSLFDQEATDAEKEELIEERKEEFHTETVETWTKEAKIKVNDKVWAKVSLEGLKVNAVTPKEDDDSKADDKKEESKEDTSKEDASQEGTTDDSSEGTTGETAE